MTGAFVDALYWIAFLHSKDPWHGPAIAARRALGPVPIVTTEGVLAEVLAALGRGRYLRGLASEMVREILEDPDTSVVPQTRELFLRGLALYEARPDKLYSLTDCISMTVMRSLGLVDVLTNDAHFTQEGFNILIRRPAS